MSPGVSGKPYLLNQNSIDLRLEFLLASKLSASFSKGDTSYSKFKNALNEYKVIKYFNYNYASQR